MGYAENRNNGPSISSKYLLLCISNRPTSFFRRPPLFFSHDIFLRSFQRTSLLCRCFFSFSTSGPSPRPARWLVQKENEKEEGKAGGAAAGEEKEGCVKKKGKVEGKRKAARAPWSRWAAAYALPPSLLQQLSRSLSPFFPRFTLFPFFSLPPSPPSLLLHVPSALLPFSLVYPPFFPILLSLGPLPLPVLLQAPLPPLLQSSHTRLLLALLGLAGPAPPLLHPPSLLRPWPAPSFSLGHPPPPPTFTFSLLPSLPRPSFPFCRAPRSPPAPRLSLTPLSHSQALPRLLALSLSFLNLCNFFAFRPHSPFLSLLTTPPKPPYPPTPALSILLFFSLSPLFTLTLSPHPSFSSFPGFRSSALASPSPIPFLSLPLLLYQASPPLFSPCTFLPERSEDPLFIFSCFVCPFSPILPA